MATLFGGRKQASPLGKLSTYGEAGRRLMRCPAQAEIVVLQRYLFFLYYRNFLLAAGGKLPLPVRDNRSGAEPALSIRGAKELPL